MSSMFPLRDSAWRWLWLALTVVMLDQATKYLVRYLLEYGQTVPILPVVNVLLTFNSGAAFSFLSEGSGWQRCVLSAIAGVVSAVLVVWILRQRRGEHTRLVFALALILGGAVGNLWDRLALGVVVDFIDLHWSSYHWPAFNVADSAICVGAVMVAWISFFGEKREPKQGLTST